MQSVTAPTAFLTELTNAVADLIVGIAAIVLAVIAVYRLLTRRARKQSTR